MINLPRIANIVEFHNKLVKEFNLPDGELTAYNDDGYVGECYAIEWDTDLGDVTLTGDSHKVMYSFLMFDGSSGWSTEIDSWEFRHNLAVSIRNCYES
mgnify:CR=1 FL=1